MKGTMTMMGVAVAALCVGLSAVRGAPAADRVLSMPTLDSMENLTLYSGYVNLSTPMGGKHLHYMLAESEGDPTKDPLVLWLTGGPGCASDSAAFEENGPLMMNATLPPAQAVFNPYRWNKLATMMWLDMPAGVGFSYADENPAGYQYNDTTSQTENLAAVLELLAMFPEYSDRPFFITGESYAGVYVPMLARAVQEHNAIQAARRRGEDVTDRAAALYGGVHGPLSKDTTTTINLHGIAVGNGCTGTETGGCSAVDGPRIDVEFLAGHDLISDEVYQHTLAVCNDSWMSPACQQAAGDAYNSAGPIFIYDVLRPCVDFSTASASSMRAPKPWLADWKAASSRAATMEHVGGLGDGPRPCLFSNDSTTDYLNRVDVREALHVVPASVTGPWRVCGQVPNKLNYTSTMQDETREIYPYLINDSSIRVMIYNGNEDLCVPTPGNEEWTSRVGTSVAGGVINPWHPWLVEGQVKGYATTYAKDFEFVTVTGSGHMVPQFTPEAAFNMIQRFFNAQPL